MTQASIIWTEQDLLDIMTTAVEGGIGHWATVISARRVGEVGYWQTIVIGPAESGDGSDWPCRKIAITPELLQTATAALLADPAMAGTAAHRAIASGDAGDVDSEAADCLVQYAAFGEVVYG